MPFELVRRRACLAWYAEGHYQIFITILREYGFVGDMLALVFSNGRAVHRIMMPVSAFGGRKPAAAFAAKLEDIGAGTDASAAEAPECVVDYISNEKALLRTMSGAAAPPITPLIC